MKKTSAVALFITTVAAIAAMWHPAFWVTAGAELMAFGLAALWLISSLRGSVELRLEFVVFPLIAAALWPLLQLATGVTVYRWNTSVSVLYWATSAAVVFVGLQIFGDAAVRKWYLRALLVAGFVIAVIAPLQLFTAEGKIFWLFETPYADFAAGRFVMGPFVYANQYAAFIELILPVALTGVVSDRTGWRPFHGLAAAVMYASIFAARSRAGFILTTLEVLLVPLVAAKLANIPWRQLALPGTVFVGMLIVLGLAVGPENLIIKLQYKDPYGGRREMAESSFRMFRDKPLMGVGMGNWPAVYPAYATFDDGFFVNQAHNDWAQWAVEGGLPFAFLMLSVAIWSVPRAIRSGWGIGVLAVFVHCYVDYPIQRMGVALVFFTLLAAIASPDGRDALRTAREPPAGIRNRGAA